MRNALRPHALMLSIVAAIACSITAVTGADWPSREERILIFNVPKSVGTLYLVDPRASSSKAMAVSAAFGTVKVSVPPNQWLKLELNGELFSHPNEMKGLPTTGIDALATNFIEMDEKSIGMCDKLVAKAGCLKSLKGLILSASDTTDAGVEQIAQMPQLERICAQMTEIRGTCFKNFSKQFPNLRSIVVWDSTDLKEDNLKYLSALPKLSQLDLRDCGVDDRGVKYVCQCKQLEALTLANNPKITDASISDVLPLKHLISLALNGTAVTFAGAKQLGSLHLKFLGLPQESFTAQQQLDMKKLAKYVHLSPVRGTISR